MCAVPVAAGTSLAGDGQGGGSGQLVKSAAVYISGKVGQRNVKLHKTACIVNVLLLV